VAVTGVDTPLLPMAKIPRLASETASAAALEGRGVRLALQPDDAAGDRCGALGDLPDGMSPEHSDEVDPASAAGNGGAGGAAAVAAATASAPSASPRAAAPSSGPSGSGGHPMGAFPQPTTFTFEELGLPPIPPAAGASSASVSAGAGAVASGATGEARLLAGGVGGGSASLPSLGPPEGLCAGAGPEPTSPHGSSPAQGKHADTWRGLLGGDPMYDLPLGALDSAGCVQSPGSDSGGAGGGLQSPVDPGAAAATAAAKAVATFASKIATGSPGCALDVGSLVGARIRALREEFFVVRFAPLPAGGGEDADATRAVVSVLDDANVLSCEFFDTRSGFLRMCQGNNYQVCVWGEGGGVNLG
jgi:hypothetical protein